MVIRNGAICFFVLDAASQGVSPCVSVYLMRDGFKHLLCTLQNNGPLFQQALDLNFDVGEKLTFTAVANRSMKSKGDSLLPLSLQIIC